MLASEWIVTQHESRVRKVDPEAALVWGHCLRLINCSFTMDKILQKDM